MKSGKKDKNTRNRTQTASGCSCTNEVERAVILVVVFSTSLILRV